MQFESVAHIAGLAVEWRFSDLTLAVVDDAKCLLSLTPTDSMLRHYQPVMKTNMLTLQNFNEFFTTFNMSVFINSNLPEISIPIQKKF